MKKDLLTFLFCILIMPGLAQITVNSDNIIGAGKVVVLGIDTTSNFTAGNGGEDQTWDYTSVLTQAHDTMWFIPPDQTPFPNAFPDANLALRIFIEDAYMYLSHTAQELSVLGGMISFPELPGMDLRAPITPKQVIAAFPMNYLDNYTQSFVQEIKVVNTIPALKVDSIWIKMYTTQTTIVDAWGELTSPLGTFAVLRVKETATMVDSIFGYMLGSWMLIDNDGYMDEMYSWWTDDSNIGYPIVELNIDTETGFMDDIFFLAQEPYQSINEPIAVNPGLTLFPNPTSDKVTVRFRIQDSGSFGSAQDRSRIIGFYSIDGQKVFEIKVEQNAPGLYETDIDISVLPSGMYFVRVQGGSQVETQKLIIGDQ